MKNIIVIFALLIIAPIISAQEDFFTLAENPAGAEPVLSEKVIDLNNRGVIESLTKQNYAEAVELFRQAVKLEDRCRQCHYNLGMALYRFGQDDEALQIFKEVISRNPDYIAVYAGLGDLYNKKGLLDESAAVYEKAVELSPQNYILLGNLGDALNKVGKYDRALTFFDRAIKSNHAFAILYNNRGTALHLLGRHKEAISNFQKALSLDPTMGRAENNLGVVMSALGKDKEAHKHYLEAARLAPRDTSCLYNLMLSHLRQGNREAARENLNLLSEIDAALAEQGRKAFYAKYLIDARSQKSKEERVFK